MKLTGLIQAAILLVMIAFAASCEVSKQYASRVFKPVPPQKRPDSTALRFMQFDSGTGVDSIDLKDFANKETKDANQPALPRDSIKTEVATVETKKPPVEQPLDATRKGSIRTKRVRN